MFSPKPFSHIPEIGTPSQLTSANTAESEHHFTARERSRRHGTFHKTRSIVCSQTSRSSSYLLAKERNTDGQGARCAFRRASRTGSTGGFRTLHGNGARRQEE